MPAIASITVADATPTNHILLPQQASLALSTWMAKETTMYEANPRLAISMSPPSKARATTRVKATLHFPFERTSVDGVLSVPDTIIYTAEAVIPAACSDPEALKVFTVFKNLMANSFLLSYLGSREPAW